MEQDVGHRMLLWTHQESLAVFQVSHFANHILLMGRDEPLHARKKGRANKSCVP